MSTSALLDSGPRSRVGIATVFVATEQRQRLGQRLQRKNWRATFTSDCLKRWWTSGSRVSKMLTHVAHFHHIPCQLCRTQLILSLQKYLRATMAPPSGSTIQMQLRKMVWYHQSCQPEPRRCGPAISARSLGRAELFKERLDRERLKDAETGVEHLLATLRPHLVKDGQSVFLHRFFQMFRCNRGFGARLSALDGQVWDNQTEGHSFPVGSHDTETRSCQRRSCCRGSTTGRSGKRTTASRGKASIIYSVRAPDGLQAHVNAVALSDAPPAKIEMSVETVWRVHRRVRVGQFPISDNVAVHMALVVADLSESQRETPMNLIFQRGVDLTAITVQQLREFLITFVRAQKSSLDNTSWTHRTGSRSFIAISHGELDEYEGHWVQVQDSRMQHRRGGLRWWAWGRALALWWGLGLLDLSALPRQVPEKMRRKGQRKGQERKNKGGKWSASRRFFRPYRKGGGKCKKSGKTDNSSQGKHCRKKWKKEKKKERKKRRRHCWRTRRGKNVRNRRRRQGPANDIRCAWGWWGRQGGLRTECCSPTWSYGFYWRWVVP